MFFACFAPAVLMGLHQDLDTAGPLPALHRQDSTASHSSAASSQATIRPEITSASDIIDRFRSTAWSVTKSIQRYQRALSVNLKFRLQLTEHFSITNMSHTDAQIVEDTNQFRDELERKNSLPIEMKMGLAHMKLENG